MFALDVHRLVPTVDGSGHQRVIGRYSLDEVEGTLVDMSVTTTIFVWLIFVEPGHAGYDDHECGSGKGSEPPPLPTHTTNAKAGASGNIGSPNMLTPPVRSTSAAASSSKSLAQISGDDQGELESGDG